MTAKEISDYMRAIQKKAAAARWAGKTKAQRSAEMKKVRAAKRKKVDAT